MKTNYAAEVKHTPGPWAISTNGKLKSKDNEVWTLGLYSIRIAEIDGNSEEQRANARLIAAAPKLLEALQYILPALKDTFDTIGDDYSKEAYNKAKEAINKATK